MTEPGGGPQGLKYLLSSPLQKKFATFASRNPGTLL